MVELMSRNGIVARSIATFLIVWAFAIISPLVAAEAYPSNAPELEGGITLWVHTDKSIEVEIVGSSLWTTEPWQAHPPVSVISLTTTNSPSGEDVCEIDGSIRVTLGPDIPEELSDLDLDVSAHWERMRSEATVFVNIPGIVGVDGSMVYEALEDPPESTLDLDLTLTLWYSSYPREDLELFVQMFPMLKAELGTQVGEYTEGKIRIEELDLLSSELGPLSAELTLTARIAGEFGPGMLDLSKMYSMTYLGLLQAAPALGFEWLNYTSLRTGDLQISFDKEEMGLSADFEVVLEGDLDEQVNAWKEAFFEDLLEESYGTEEREVINEFLLPTSLSVVDLRTAFDYSLEGDTHEIRFSVEGLSLEPPTPQALLKFLGRASGDVEQPSFTLTIEGASDGDEYVEIVVPEATSEPLSEEPRKVVWAFDEIENLEMVTFEVKEQAKASPLASPQVVIPIAGVAAVAVAAAGFMLFRKR